MGPLPPALRNFSLEFDRDGRLTKGPAVSRARQPRRDDAGGAADMRQTRSRLREVAASVADPGLRRVLRSPLSLFNGPRSDGNATVIAHARALVPPRRPTSS